MDISTVRMYRESADGLKCYLLSFFVGQVTYTRREISLFIRGDSVPFRPRHGRVHQSPRIDENAAKQWPCCGPINTLRLRHFCLTLTSGNENYSRGPLLFFFSIMLLSYKTTATRVGFCSKILF